MRNLNNYVVDTQENRTPNARKEHTTMDLKKLIEKVLSEILSDKYECKVTLQFRSEKTA